MKVTPQISQQIDILRFPLIVSIIFIHMGSNYSQIITSETSSPFIFRYFIFLFSTLIGGVAVPLFFVISSFLLFRNYTFSWSCYKQKMKARLKTLLIPYLVWNLAFLLFKLAIQLTPFFLSAIGGSSERLWNYDLLDYANAFVGWQGFPIAYQFWFIRDLILMVTISPVFWILTKKFHWGLIVFFMVIWFVDPPRLFNIHNETYLFIALGCLVAQSSFSLVIAKKWQYSLILSYAIWVAVATALEILNVAPPLTLKVSIILGVLTIWYSSSFLLNWKYSNVLFYLSSYAFFVYAGHEPLLGILYKAFSKVLYVNSYIVAFTLYWTLPVLCLLLLCFTKKYLEQLVPSFYKLIVGGR